MMDFAGLADGKVTLRPFSRDDITPAYLGWLNDPEITRFSNQRFRTHTRASAADYLAGFEGSANLFLSIRDAADDTAIGTMSAYRIPHHGLADIGIMVGARSRWGAGYGQAAWNLLSDWLLANGTRKLTGGTLAGNGGMVRIFERSGMHLEATRKDHEIVEGTPMDILLYARFAD